MVCSEFSSQKAGNTVNSRESWPGGFRGPIRDTARRESKQIALQSLRAGKLSMGDCNWSCCVRDGPRYFPMEGDSTRSKQEWADWLSGYWQQKANEIALLM